MKLTSNTVNDGSGDAEVIGLLREQAVLFERLEFIAGRQRSLITDDRADSLLALLADRQRLSLRLTDVANRLAPIRRKWKSWRDRLDPPDQTLADELVRDAETRLRRLMMRDEEDARLLASRKQQIARELNRVDAGGRAMSAYGGVVVQRRVSGLNEES